MIRASAQRALPPGFEAKSDDAGSYRGARPYIYSIPSDSSESVRPASEQLQTGRPGASRTERSVPEPVQRRSGPAWLWDLREPALRWLVGVLMVVVAWLAGQTYQRMTSDIDEASKKATSALEATQLLTADMARSREDLKTAAQATKDAADKAANAVLEISRAREDFANQMGGVRAELVGLRGDMKADSAAMRGEMTNLTTKLEGIESVTRATLDEIRRNPSVQPKRGP